MEKLSCEIKFIVYISFKLKRRQRKQYLTAHLLIHRLFFFILLLSLLRNKTGGSKTVELHEEQIWNYVVNQKSVTKNMFLTLSKVGIVYMNAALQMISRYYHRKNEPTLEPGQFL